MASELKPWLVRVRPAQLAAIRKAAAREDLTAPQVLRRIIDEWMRGREVDEAMHQRINDLFHQKLEAEHGPDHPWVVKHKQQEPGK